MISAQLCYAKSVIIEVIPLVMSDKKATFPEILKWNTTHSDPLLALIVTKLQRIFVGIINMQNELGKWDEVLSPWGCLCNNNPSQTRIGQLCCCAGLLEEEQNSWDGERCKSKQCLVGGKAQG